MKKRINYSEITDAKTRKAFLNNMYRDYASLIAANQFNYKTPDFTKSYYESNILKGIAAFYKVPNILNSVNSGKWVCTPVHMADVVNNYGISDVITTRGSDYALELKVDEDCVLIRNNSMHLPESYISVIADFLTETDISMRSLLRWSRMTPIPKTQTDEQQVQYEMAMRRIIDGEEITTVSDPLKFLSDSHDTIDDNLLRITDESAIEKMHFYSEFYEQQIRRICTLRGLPFSSTAKSSQNLTEELHDMDLFAELYIKDCFETRKHDFEKAGKFANFDFEFDWSDTMKRQFESNIVSRETKKSEKDGAKNEKSLPNGNGNTPTE